jgi:hypothetical protein
MWYSERHFRPDFAVLFFQGLSFGLACQIAISARATQPCRTSNAISMDHEFIPSFRIADYTSTDRGGVSFP